MSKSYAELLKQIKALRKEADELRRREAAEVIARIKEIIAQYHLTTDDLFGSGRRAKTRSASTDRSKKAAGSRPRYADGTGNTWGGRGPRPRWLREALVAGRPLADFEVKHRAAGNGAARVKRPTARAKRGAEVKYRDEAGNTWSGRGPRPRWLKEALEAGRALEDLAV